MEAQLNVLIDQLNTAANDQAEHQHRLNEMIALVLPNLRKRAHMLLRIERPGHLLQTTALVNELWMRLIRARLALRTQAEFLALAGIVMKRILLDYARSAKPATQISVLGAEPAVQLPVVNAATLISLDQLVSKLDKDDADLVHQLYFVGTTFNELAEIIGITPGAVRARWYEIRRNLSAQLGGNSSNP